MFALTYFPHGDLTSIHIHNVDPELLAKLKAVIEPVLLGVPKPEQVVEQPKPQQPTRFSIDYQKRMEDIVLRLAHLVGKHLVGKDSRDNPDHGLAVNLIELISLHRFVSKKSLRESKEMIEATVASGKSVVDESGCVKAHLRNEILGYVQRLIHSVALEKRPLISFHERAVNPGPLNKIELIKLVRYLFGYDLLAAKRLVDKEMSYAMRLESNKYWTTFDQAMQDEKKSLGENYSALPRDEQFKIAERVINGD